MTRMNGNNNNNNNIGSGNHNMPTSVSNDGGASEVILANTSTNVTTSGNVNNQQVTNSGPAVKDEQIISTGEGSNLKRDTDSKTHDVASDHLVVPGRQYAKPAPDLLQIQDYFRKPVWIYTFDWTTSTTVVTIQPYALWEGIATVNSRFSYFNKRSYNLILSISLAATPQHIGMAVLDWNPSDRGTATVVGSLIGTQRRHVKLTPQDSTYELAIPHWSDTPNIVGSAAGASGRGTLSFAPLGALQRADAVAPGTIKVVVRAFTRDMEQTEPSFCQTAGEVSAGLTAAKGVLDDGITFAQMASTVIGAIGTIFSFFGLTIKKVDTIMPMSMKNFNNNNNVDGERVVEVMNTNKENAIVPQDFGEDFSDQLVLSSICSRFGAIAFTTTYDTTRATGYQVLNIPITPLMAISLGSDVYYPTPCGYVSTDFNQWCGSLVYRITVISCAFQQGALLISHEPSTTPVTSGNSTQAASTARACILDLAETKSLDIIVSSAGGTNEVLPMHPDNSVITNVGKPLFYAQNSSVSLYHAGTLSIAVNKPLISTGASACHILVEMAAGPDFQLMNWNQDWQHQYTYTCLSVKPPQSCVKPITCDLRIYQFDDIREKHSGEAVVSYRALLNRLQPHKVKVAIAKSDSVAPVVQNWSNSLQYVTQNTRLGQGASMATTTVSDVNFNDLLCKVSCLFARRTGGLRHVIRFGYRSSGTGTQWVTVQKVTASSADPVKTYNQNQVVSGGGFNRCALASGNNAATWDVMLRFSETAGVMQDIRQNATISLQDTATDESTYAEDTIRFMVAYEMTDNPFCDNYSVWYRSSAPDTQFYEWVGVPRTTCVVGAAFGAEMVGNGGGFV